MIRYICLEYPSIRKHLLEDLEELSLLNFPISRFVDSVDEAFDFLLGDFAIGFELSKGIVDEVKDLRGLETVAMVSIVLPKDGIDGFP
jgi:hypothetical protein